MQGAAVEPPMRYDNCGGPAMYGPFHGRILIYHRPVMHVVPMPTKEWFEEHPEYPECPKTSGSYHWNKFGAFWVWKQEY